VWRGPDIISRAASAKLKAPRHMTVPYVAIAVFCADARQNPDGTLTLNDILDRLAVSDAAVRLPQVASVVAVVAVRCRPPWGAHQLGLDVHEPGGAVRRLTRIPVDTATEGENVARILRLDLEIHQFGDYWFDVGWDDQVVTRIRLSVVRVP
jgi:hypothetical protein